MQILRLFRWRAALALCFALAAGCARAADPPVQVCFDEADHTPYLYRDAQGRWQGATLALTRAVLDRAGLAVQWRPMPWPRCLREVQEVAQRGEIELLIYGSRNQERERQFLFTQPLHRVTGGVWYSRRSYPQGPRLERLEDLGQYRLCGIHGYNYGWLSERGVSGVDSGALSLKAVLDKLARGRCELVLSSREPVRGAAQLGFVSLPEDFEFLPYPGREPVSQHLLVGRGSPRAEELLRRLDQALSELHASGAAHKLYKPFLPDGTGLP
ncbi:substrate-binding periplasmic protein [Inhella proteolytica]|uniref:Transporter substrate-binding domain-containing protein n=1 Tax=Inhella proteolytica TaxID=2795029 RepID=A0A931J9K0_9BURK|nr:transporter substrate-binding domain-containing protein [Inhella proteolytica]MBH9579297.1 transporter substrate-binding domain-containing protein [Inhella proteolytica]